jgi:hypothetical protein
LALAALAIAASGAATTRAAPVISEPFASRFQITNATPIGDLPLCTQMAFGPDGRLYVTRYQGQVFSYAYNPATGALFDKQPAGVSAFGIAFASHAVPGQGVQNYMYVSNTDNFEGVITRFGNTNGNFIWGEAGETNVDLVRGIPTGDHTLDQIQIRNNQLFIGIGARTNNGRSGDFSGQNFHDTPGGPVAGGFGAGPGELGNTLGDTSYNGAIGTIRDLTQVPNLTSAAQLRDGPNGTSGALLAGRDAFLPAASTAILPYTSTANDKLVVHSAGTRNPYGLAINSSGQLYFTANYGRADTNGDGTSNPHLRDLLDSDLSNDVHDQFFLAVAGGDYRYDNVNFRGTPGFPTTPVISTTFDNLDANRPGFGALHDSANPDGLGPSSSSNGFDFGTIDLTGLGLATDAKEYAVISRWSPPTPEEPPGTDVIDYRDLVVVDPATGKVRRLAEGFDDTIDVRNDGHGGFFVADWGPAGTIWHVTPRVATSRWNIANGGIWSSAGNWTGPVPNGIGAVANFTGAIGADATVAVDGPKTLGTLNFDNPHRYTLAGSSTITIDVAAGHGAINVISGSHAVQTPVSLLKNTTIDVAKNSVLSMSGDMTTAAGVTLTRTGAGRLEVKHLRADEVNLLAGNTKVLPNGTSAAISMTRTLTIAGAGTPAATLDLSNNSLVIDYNGVSPLATIAAQIAYAYHNGAWDRTGITSSLADSTHFALGYLDDGDTLTIDFTRYGDADLNGAVNLLDFNRLASNFGQGGRFWQDADFNYDGTVNLLDFNLLAGNFGLSAAGPDVTPQDWARLASAVPEPAFAILAIFPLVARRRASRFSG